MTSQLSLRAALLLCAVPTLSTPSWAQDIDLGTVDVAEETVTPAPTPRRQPAPAAASLVEEEVVGLTVAEDTGDSQRDVQTGTALAVTFVDQQEINERQASTMYEVLQTVPGVTAINGINPDGSAVNIRGFGGNSAYGTDQLVGVQVNGASSGSEEIYRLGTQMFTDPELYKEVTVIRGMAGTYEFGSGLVGGLIRSETKDAVDFTGGEPGFKLRQTLQYSTNGDNYASSTVGAWQLTENFGVIGNFTYRHNGQATDAAGNVITLQPANFPSYHVGALLTAGSSNEHAFRFTYANTQSARYDIPYDTYGGTGTWANVDREMHDKVATFEYKFDSPTTELINLTANLSYADQKVDNTEVGGYTNPLYNTQLRYKTTKLTLKNQALFNTGAIDHDFRFGVEAIQKYREEAYAAPGGKDNRLAVFAVDDMSWGGLTLSPAVRYEKQTVGGSTTYGGATYDNDAFMGGVTARYEFGNSGFAVFGSAGYTENLPILDDQSNPIFMAQSQKARSYEVGASFGRDSVLAEGDRLSMKVNAFRTTLWDVTSYSGIDQIETQGVEFEGSYSMANGFYTDVAAAFMSGTERDSTTGVVYDFAGIPSNELRVTLGKRFGANQEFDVSYEGVYNAEMGAVNTRSATLYAMYYGTPVPTPATFVHNISAAYTAQDGWLAGTEFRVGVDNLLNLDYTPHLASRKAIGRNITFTVARTF